MAAVVLSNTVIIPRVLRYSISDPQLGACVRQLGIGARRHRPYFDPEVMRDCASIFLPFDARFGFSCRRTEQR